LFQNKDSQIMPDPIKIYTLNNDKADLIKTLWEGLRDHHQKHTTYFANRYGDMTFEKRKEALLAKTGHGKLNIDVVEDTQSCRIIAYCISSIEEGLQGCIGEIDSIFIDEGYRKQGIGDKLMVKALQWLESEDVQEKRIVVAEGNESVFDFYRKYGFYQLHHILQQKENVLGQSV
jgi:ribosomal protein S18 acetylase RimI-like enzyme